MLSISSEIGGYGRVSVEGVRVAERGLDNVLKWLGMIEGKPDTSQRDGSAGTRHMQVRDQTSYVFAPSNGLFEPLHLAGAQVRAGQLAGYLHFIEEWARRRSRSNSGVTARSGWRPARAACGRATSSVW